MNTHGFPPTVGRNKICDVGSSCRWFKPGGKAMQQPQKQKSCNGGEQRVKQAANNANQRANRHHRNPANRIGQPATEWP